MAKRQIKEQEAEPDRDPGVTDEEIAERMDRGLRRAFSTPPKPHQPLVRSKRPPKKA
jgi:hypothetical protein